MYSYMYSYMYSCTVKYVRQISKIIECMGRYSDVKQLGTLERIWIDWNKLCLNYEPQYTNEWYKTGGILLTGMHFQRMYLEEHIRLMALTNVLS